MQGSDRMFSGHRGISLREKERLKNRGWMRKSDIEITQADSTPMKIRGMVKLLVKIRGKKSI